MEINKKGIPSEATIEMERPVNLNPNNGCKKSVIEHNKYKSKLTFNL